MCFERLNVCILYPLLTDDDHDCVKRNALKFLNQLKHANSSFAQSHSSNTLHKIYKYGLVTPYYSYPVNVLILFSYMFMRKWFM